MAPYCRSRPMARSALPPGPDAPRVLACSDVQRCAFVRFRANLMTSRIARRPATTTWAASRRRDSAWALHLSIRPSTVSGPRVVLGLWSLVAGRVPWGSTKAPWTPPCQPHHHPPEGPTLAAVPPPPTLPAHIPLSSDIMALSAVFKRVLFIAVVALAAVSDVEATRVMSRPANFNGTATNHAVNKRAASGKVNAAYFTNWCVPFWVLGSWSLADRFLIAGLSTLGTTSVRITFQPSIRSVLNCHPLLQSRRTSTLLR